MNEMDVLRDISRKFEQAEIPYMLTGSLAMNYYAQPRMTRDIDVVIAVAPEQVDAIVQLFSPEYYVSREAVQESVAHESIFNVIHQETVIKVDCIVRKTGEYRRVEFERRQPVKILDFTTWIVSKEDLIVSKLWWAKDSHSELQLRDVQNILATGYDAAIWNAGRSRWVWVIYSKSAGMNDTQPEIERLVREKIMARSGEERFVMGAQMFEAARAMICASFPPGLSADETRRRLYERLYGEPLQQH